jgi:hypothetical protein|uniref:Uncharacterized protein n=1 Tax=Myoviridae sp. ctshb19 TaxID=2825194 RepID=A0A8S5UGJ7_9CAUD|nr:MAG TPA: hypothetical protein [Myoviridae sp. ctshb19]
MDIHHRHHPRASRLVILADVVTAHFLVYTKLNWVPTERHYDTEQDVATTIYLLSYNSEIFGHATFTHKQGETAIKFNVVKNNKLLAEGAGIKDWCRYMKMRGVLRPWIEVEEETDEQQKA